MEGNSKPQTLNRTLGLAECVTITAGAVIGVGLFTVGSNIVGIMGGTVIIASLISFVLILFPCCRWQAVPIPSPREPSTILWLSSKAGTIRWLR